jgi:hydrogenase-4 component B
MTSTLLVVTLLLFGLAALAAAVVPGPTAARRLALAGIGLGALLDVVVALAVLAGVEAPALSWDTGLPLGPLRLGLDPLSAVFLVLVGVLLVPAAIYADGYLAPEQDHQPVRGHLVEFALLATAMTLVVTARDGVTFLIAWELLAWASYLTVILEVGERTVSRAAYLMLAVSELGAFGLIAAILVMGGGQFDFGALAAGGAALGEPVRSLVFVALVAGFGAKAGLVPLQLWLPEAHPAAPSHISAVLSAAIVKLGLYGIIRFAIVSLPAPAPWWGPALVIVGGVTAVVAILWALFQSDLKRVLAYSTIENVGIITAAIGLSETFRGDGNGTMASMSLVIALFAILAHGLAKGLLFLGAGAVDRATGTRELEQLGGLLRRMPFTGAAILVGALSIAAVAPLAGFLGEWMVLEVFLQGFRLTSISDRVVVVAIGALLALTAATAVMVFVRLYAVGFVGQPRSTAAAEATDGPRSMRVAMGLLAAALLCLGFLPTFVLPVLDHAVTGLVGPSVIGQLVPPVFGPDPGPYAPLVGLGGGLFGAFLPVPGLIVIPSPVFSTIDSPTYLTLAELAALAIIALIVRLLPRMAADRRVPVWAGGIPRFLPAMQYSALAYANPVRLIFAVAFRSRATSSAPRAATGGLEGIAYEQVVDPPLERRVYSPILAAVGRLADGVKTFQSGDINHYVAYIFLIVLLVLLLRVV